MSRLGKAFLSASLSLALFGLGRFLFNLLGLRVFGPVAIGRLNVSISTWTLMAVVVATVPSFVASKYVSEYLVSAQPVRAARILAACLGTTWTLSTLIIVGSVIADPSKVNPIWAAYGLAYATYLVLRSAYFSHQKIRAVLISEMLGFGVFASALGVGLLTSSVLLVSLALAAQPALYSVKGLWDFRKSIRFNGAFNELRSNIRSYGVFSGATMANATTAMASYHLAIVLAGRLVDQPADVGYLSVLLSAMSPVNLVPQALGAVLFAEFARRHGASDQRGSAAVALRSTVFIQIFVLLFVGALISFPDVVFPAVGLPITRQLLLTWTWLVYALGLTIASSPCGHLLNATKHAPRQAIASLTFLVLGVTFGVWGMPQVGIVAAGWMRFGVDGGLAWTRMAMAERLEPWLDRRWIDVLAFQAFYGSLFLQALLMNGRLARALTLAAGAFVLLMLARGELARFLTSFRWQRTWLQ